ncbi:AEC family transporter [Propionispora vibrioides]|uniref:Membrane transport protein n=1 Tax=Propionispora vibrioides TaxID=112903 RepID=A0A1H8RBC5_9FIRM|nr:AEC family transporter [Propionispora vibrioides]SEO63656.1 hypothetical protein SAMN04490178_103230 [Propionispora vibrioides]
MWRRVQEKAAGLVYTIKYICKEGIKYSDYILARIGGMENMAVFLYILSYNIIPICLLILLGFLLGKRFRLDVFTLSKLNFYLFTPAFLFVNLYNTSFHWDLLQVVFCGFSLILVNALLGEVIGRYRNYERSFTNAFKNSIMFSNVGNIGLALATLIFSGEPFLVDGKTPYLDTAVAAQIMVLIMQNICVNTWGFFNAGQARLSGRQAVLQMLRMPPIYALPLVVLCRAGNFAVEQTFLWPALSYLRDGMVPLILITLGVQLSQSVFHFASGDVYLAVAIRLVGGPLLAMAGIALWGLSGVAAQIMLIANAVPTAVNTALIAVECRNCPEFAAQTVMVSTLLSVLTLTFFIFLARLIYPVA